MVLGLFLLFATTPAVLAESGDWPDIHDIYVGDSFKYPILGTSKSKVRPTQEAVGMRAVAVKRKAYADMDHGDLKKSLKNDLIPVVAGPDGNLYMIDHHHEAHAAHEAGRENAFFVLHTDYTKLPSMDEFWKRMKAKHWVREYDHLGKPIPIPDGLPKSILGMRDDPYRSLAYFVRERGGYAKTDVEFAEFRWADYFRSRIDTGNSKADFKRATDLAERLAHEPEASALPGWSPKKLKCEDFLSSLK